MYRFKRRQTKIASRRSHESLFRPIGDLGLSYKHLIDLVRTPEYIGILVIINGGGHTITSDAFNITDGLYLLINVSGDLGNVTRHFTCYHCVTAFVLRSALILPHLLISRYHKIPILSIRIIGLGGINTGVGVRLVWENALTITPAYFMCTTTSASAASSLTVTNLTATTVVNARDLAIIYTVTRLAYKKVIRNMASCTIEIVMQYRCMGLGNAMIDSLCLYPLQE